MSPTPDAPTPTRAEQNLDALRKLRNRLLYEVCDGDEKALLPVDSGGRFVPADLLIELVIELGGLEMHRLRGELAEVEASAVPWQPIDNGNIYVFCDATERPNVNGPIWSCCRGAGHNGPHAFSDHNARRLFSPVLLKMPLPACPHGEPKR